MLGFHRAGCRSACGVELDPHAASTYSENFHGSELLHAEPMDVTEVDPHRLMRAAGYRRPTRAVDILVGGPPCPAFTRVGRAKLREINNHPEAYKHDPRSQLYIPFLGFVERLAPLAVLMENVPDFLNWGGHNLGEEVADVLEGLGYRCSYTLLNSANYGVPQMRERFYLIAVAEEAECRIRFPEPVRFVNFPQGYKSSREVALKNVAKPGLFDVKTRFVETPVAKAELPPPTTVEEALSDLAPITEHLSGTKRRGARRFTEPIEYRAGAAPSAYAARMRGWPGFSGTEYVLDHVTRSLSERDYRIFRLMKPGDQYPEAHAIATNLFERELSRLVAEPGVAAKHEELRRLFVPPYDPGKFPNRWRKMEPDKPSRTLMAHLGKDSYTHIHYDSAQARVLSVREAARLQSFPDGFRFSGTMNPAFRQIGNAVPPLMAAYLAAEILVMLGQSRVLIDDDQFDPNEKAVAL